MMESMKSKVYQRKTMYRCAGLPLAFQCWFYKYCSYADGHLANRVGDSVPHILNRFVKYKPAYKEVKSAFFNIRQEQVVLHNITPTVLEKQSFNYLISNLWMRLCTLLICLAPVNKIVVIRAQIMNWHS
ncbi:hypothetical protein BC332_11117 [Capsicum chinense]|nr:hypothetical protein BC332_11117 [Capsicum chinense]